MRYTYRPSYPEMDKIPKLFQNIPKDNCKLESVII